MPGPKLYPVHADAVLPRETDVVVIGGGVIGCFAALEMAERGHRVLLVEKGEIGGEQSSRNWGWVRVGMRDLREVPLMLEALALWQTLDARIEGDSGFTRSGIVFGCEDEKTEESHESWLRAFAAEGYLEQLNGGPGIEMIGPAGLKALYPGLSGRSRSALHAAVDGRAEPQRVAPLVAGVARAKGAFLATGCAALGLDWKAGQVAGVETERGYVKCQTVIMAAGVWTSAMARLDGIDFPQLNVLNSVMRTRAPASGIAVPEAALWTSKYAFRRRADGGYTIASAAENIFEIVPASFRHASAFRAILRQDWKSLRPRISRHAIDEWLAWRGDAFALHGLMAKHRVLDPKPAMSTLRRAHAALVREYPVFESLAVEQVWAGMIEVVPDAVPVISKVDGHKGLIIATGFSGHGFGISPAAGRLAADLATGDRPVVDPHAFRISRFSDGTPITVMGGV